MFGMANRKGLSNLFTSRDRIVNVGRVRKDLPNLMIVTSGSMPENPAELLGSTRMAQVLNEISSHVDVAIIDTPPSLVADAQILLEKDAGYGCYLFPKSRSAVEQMERLKNGEVRQVSFPKEHRDG